MSKLLFCVLALSAFAFAQDVAEWSKGLDRQQDLHPDHANKTHFGHWLRKHNKVYTHDLEHRYTQWKKSVKRVWELNQRTDASWVAGLNHFSANTDEERRSILSTADVEMPSASPIDDEKRYIPDSVDWTLKGAVTPVKNQGQCGSCWAFSTAAVMESAMATSGFGSNSFSPQQIMDCAGLGGCSGGVTINAIKWGSAKGMSYWGDYPYLGKQQATCQNTTKHFWCKSVTTSVSGNDASATNIIAGGPTSVAYHVSDDFFHYHSGVYSGSCAEKTNHAVLAVGYDKNCQNSGKDCYIVKNSWGTTWGMKGFFMIQRGNNMCNIATKVYRPYDCSFKN